MGKNKAAAEKKLKKAAKEAVASGRKIKRERNDLKRKANQQKMINQLLEAQAQTHTQMMRDQQVHQEQQLILHQQLQDAMNQLASQQPVEQQRDTERRVEGLSMPAYHGHLNESIGLFIHRVKTFFMAKNLNYEQNEVVEARCLAMVVANLQGQSAAWYRKRKSDEVRRVAERH
ncbi:hypothetical protein DYB28_009126 [Aphanomyces astaci]|uniref:Uncharacterized protein n=1 Tax=Aphanomyces astaci TaxID=112090 RepID=A0A9X8DNI3_APHAT|nr:hypothetical protein DYB28_009126 [Aphanomyces astaci]